MAADVILCMACNQPNNPTMRSCGDCGAPLPLLCPACGGDNPPGKRFCGHCGSPLPGAGPPRAAVPAAPPAAAPGPALRPDDQERRLVTILFSDLVGSTALGETLDPEEALTLVSAAQEALAETVRHYGGHVAKLLGDGLMALFSAPQAHEDDAERAGHYDWTGLVIPIGRLRGPKVAFWRAHGRLWTLSTC
jgi:hypothetical protein